MYSDMCVDMYIGHVYGHAQRAKGMARWHMWLGQLVRLAYRHVYRQTRGRHVCRHVCVNMCKRMGQVLKDVRTCLPSLERKEQWI